MSPLVSTRWAAASTWLPIPSQVRQSASTAVANLVWTTASSSANSRITECWAARATGESATAEIASEGPPIASSARTTSVVVPEREIATTRS